MGAGLRRPRRQATSRDGRRGLRITEGWSHARALRAGRAPPAAPDPAAWTRARGGRADRWASGGTSEEGGARAATARVTVDSRASRTRTGDLLGAISGRTFAPVRASSLIGSAERNPRAVFGCERTRANAWGSETQSTSVVPWVREVASSIRLRIGDPAARDHFRGQARAGGMFDVAPVKLIFARAREPIGGWKCPSRSG